MVSTWSEFTTLFELVFYETSFVCLYSSVFSFNEPNGGAVENCLIIGKQSGSLGVFDRRCDHYGTGVVCEYVPVWSKKKFKEPTTTQAPDVTMYENPCGDWENHGESCYKLIEKDEINFHDALVECANENAYLAQIDTFGELVSTFELNL